MLSHNRRFMHQLQKMQNDDCQKTRFSDLMPTTRRAAHSGRRVHQSGRADHGTWAPLAMRRAPEMASCPASWRHLRRRSQEVRA